MGLKNIPILQTALKHMQGARFRRQAPPWKVSNVTGISHLRLNSDHMQKLSGESEVKAGSSKRNKGRRVPARLLALLREDFHGQDGDVEGVSGQLPFRGSWRSPLLARRGSLLQQITRMISQRTTLLVTFTL